MKPSGLRRIERELERIVEAGEEKCTVCGKGIEHNTKIFGGATASGTAALTGECCVSKIKIKMISGLHLSRNYDAIPESRKVGDGSASSAEATNAIARLQDYFHAVEDYSSSLLRQAGVKGKASVSFSDTPWKSDDAAWFEAHPQRSHRMRTMFAGEDESLFGISKMPVPPPRHEFQVLVRQVEPGKRIRKQFCRNLEVPIPDLEPVMHAMFDVVADAKEGVISIKEIAELAQKYADWK